MKIVRFKIRLTLQGPLITQSTAPGTYGLDAVMAVSMGRYYLAGSLVKGFLREAWQELGWNDLALEWLGRNSGDQQGDFDPLRARLVFEDLPGDQVQLRQPSIRFRTAMDQERGAVDDRMLLLIEAPYAPGEEAVFEGRANTVLADTEDAGELQEKILTGLRWIAALGAERTVGFGRVLAAACELETAETLSPETPAEAGDRFTLTLTFERPFCVTAQQPDRNLFRGSSEIPGAVVKGAAAALLEREPTKWQALRDNLSFVTCGTLFACRPGATRPFAAPQSLVRWRPQDRKEDAWYDALRCKEAVQLRGEARFAVDWKDKDEDVLPSLYKPSYPGREVRVRTAVESEAQRSKEQQLFAYELVEPAGLEWRGEVSFACVPGNVRNEVAAQWQALLEHGLPGIGKTKAFACVHHTPLAAPNVKLGTYVALTLQTDALLAAPQPGQQMEKESMSTLYSQAWADLSDHSLELVNFFHRQRLTGSRHFAERFQKPLHAPYRPYLLTSPGSVFWLRVTDAAQAKTCVEKWLRDRLPLPPAVVEFYQVKTQPREKWWCFLPFLPENGYGEIAVDLHTQTNVPLFEEAACTPC